MIRTSSSVQSSMAMSSPDPALVEQVGRRLLALGGIYYTCHCTSEGAYARLKDIMGEKLRRLRAGDVAEI